MHRIDKHAICGAAVLRLSGRCIENQMAPATNRTVLGRHINPISLRGD